MYFSPVAGSTSDATESTSSQLIDKDDSLESGDSTDSIAISISPRVSETAPPLEPV